MLLDTKSRVAEHALQISNQNLASVPKNDLAILKAARETAEQAETQGFNPAISTASGPGSANAVPLQNGKNKNKILKLYLHDLVNQIEQAQGKPVDQSAATYTKSQLRRALALDQANAGQPCRSVPFSSETQPVYAGGDDGLNHPDTTNPSSFVAYTPPAGSVPPASQGPIPLAQPDSDVSPQFPDPATNTAPVDATSPPNTRPRPMANPAGTDPGSIFPQGRTSGGDVAQGAGGIVAPGVEPQSDAGDACTSPSTNPIPQRGRSGSGGIAPLGANAPLEMGGACGSPLIEPQTAPPGHFAASGGGGLQSVPDSNPVSAPPSR